MTCLVGLCWRLEGQDPFSGGGEGFAATDPGRAPKGHCWFSGQPGALAGATASCRFCSSLDRGFLQANLIPSTSPLLHSAPPQVNFFFFWFVEYRALCLMPATQDHRVPCLLRTRCPGASGLIREVKQTRYYGMEPSSVAGSPGSLGTEPERGKPGWGGAGN